MSDGDRHAIVVDSSTCRLYETFKTRRKSDGRATPVRVAERRAASFGR